MAFSTLPGRWEQVARRYSINFIANTPTDSVPVCSQCTRRATESFFSTAAAALVFRFGHYMEDRYPPAHSEHNRPGCVLSVLRLAYPGSRWSPVRSCGALEPLIVSGALVDVANFDLVKIPCYFLAITRDERNRRAGFRRLIEFPRGKRGAPTSLLILRSASVVNMS